MARFHGGDQDAHSGNEMLEYPNDDDDVERVVEGQGHEEENEEEQKVEEKEEETNVGKDEEPVVKRSKKKRPAAATELDESEPAVPMKRPASAKTVRTVMKRPVAAAQDEEEPEVAEAPAEAARDKEKARKFEDLRQKGQLKPEVQQAYDDLHNKRAAGTHPVHL